MYHALLRLLDMSDSLGTIDRYVYRSPASQIYGPTFESADMAPPDEPADTTYLAPIAVDDGGVKHANPQ